MSQSTGRFWTTDSAPGEDDEPVSQHKYAFAGNDPVDNSDPSGNQFLIPTIGFEVSLSILSQIPVLAPSPSVFEHLKGLATIANEEELAFSGAVTIFHNVSGRKNTINGQLVYKRPNYNESEFKPDADGTSAFEEPYLPNNRPYAFGYIVSSVKSPKENNPGPYEIANAPGCQAEYSAPPAGHWSINCDNGTGKALAGFASGVYSIPVLRIWPFVILNPQWSPLPGEPSERRLDNP